ncbi:hypothetical protein Godav_000075 [Gossypium davidsonii]|uniref:Uncharacterized protein n=1 Tax=Gossypium davidsonii TaxID=34287 RepID=A0A7J8TFE2_GOSDV|nr:hypothetical protein [Gossypium davidsonii]
MSSETQNTAKVDAKKDYGNFGPWMIVEKKSRRKIRDNVQNSLQNQQIGKDGSRFRTLNNKDMHKDDFEGFLPDTRRHKGKEIMHGNSMKKISATPNNVRILRERNRNNKNISKEVGLMGISGPNFKGNSRILSEPSKPSISRKEKLYNLKKSDSSLGFGTIPVGQANGGLERSDPDLAAHHPSVAAGKGSRTFPTVELQTVLGDDTGLGFEGEG